jgi:branched-chain amino acid transport system substrate-binding protein
VSDQSLGDHTLSRKQFLGRVGSTSLAAVSTGGLLAACGVKSSSGSASGSSAPLKIGYVSPETGASAAFGQPDAWLLGEVRKSLANGITAGGKHYAVEILRADSQSTPARAAQVANSLINSSGVDLLLASSTPETVNPVADAAEAAGVPCISTVVPWQSWYFGRGAKPTQTHAFKFTYHFSFGAENFADSYFSMWPQVPTNRTVGVLYPNDADGNAIRQFLEPLMKKKGYTVIDPGAYADGTNDYTSQISTFKAHNCEIFNTFPLAPDFATFWKQAAQQGYKPKIAQIAKTGLFPSEVEALGSLGPGLATAVYWHPVFPYSSSLTGLNGRQIEDSYQSKTGNQWSQDCGTGLALFDVAIAAFKAASNPTDKLGLANTIASLKVDTPVGPLDWAKGPIRNVVDNAIPGAQWLKSAPGSKYPLDVVVCDHPDDPAVPIQATLKSFSSANRA